MTEDGSADWGERKEKSNGIQMKFLMAKDWQPSKQIPKMVVDLKKENERKQQKGI